VGKLFEELKRRKVVRVAGVYAVVAWLLIQVTNNIVPALQLPAWSSTLIVVLLLIGFPVALVLAWAFEVSPDGVHRQGTADAPWGGQIPVAQTANTKLLYATFTLVLVVAVFQIAERFMGNGAATPTTGSNQPSAGVLPLRSALPLGELEQFRYFRYLRSQLGLSPDGRWLAYIARLDDKVNLQLRDLVTGETSTLVQVSDERNSFRSFFNPSFSPSGEQILYSENSSGAIHVIPRAGGRPQALAVNTRPFDQRIRGQAWLSEDTIVFPNSSGEVQTLHIPTGDIVTLDIPDIDGEANVYPRLIGDGPWLLYTALPNADYESARLDAFNMDTGEVRNLVANGFKGQYLRDGFVIYMRDSGLWAVRVDEQSMQINGGERLVEDRVEANMILGLTSHALSDNGRLVYLEGGDVSITNATTRWVLSARNGERQALTLPANAYHPVFSPDGGQVAVTMLPDADAGSSNILGYIALYQLADGTLTRRSFTGAAFRPKWTPDGTQLVYGMLMDDTWGLWIMAADGSGQPRQLLTATEPVWPESITPDGASLIYAIGEFLDTRFHLLSLRETGATGQPLLEFGNSQIGAVISPDGRFVAYSSNELHRDSEAGSSVRDLIVRPFPNVNDGQWQITSSGTAAHAFWDSSGKSLYFWLNNGDIYRAPADPDNGFRQGAPELVFDSSMPQSIIYQVPGLAVSPDEQLFLYRELAAERAVLTAEATYAVLVDNWIEKVRQLVPVVN